MRGTKKALDGEQRGEVAWLIVVYLMARGVITEKDYQKAARAAVDLVLRKAKQGQ